MVLGTSSVYSDDGSALQSISLSNEVPCTRPQSKALHMEHSETEITYGSGEVDDGSYDWRDVLAGQQEEEEDEDTTPGVSCNDFIWQERSSMSAFSINFDFDASFQLSVLSGSVDGRSLDTTEYSEETTDKTVSIATFSTENSNAMLVDNGFEVRSMTSETIEMDENSVKSEYEVNSLATEMSNKKGDCRWGTGANAFADRLRQRREKRSRIMAKVSDIGSSLRQLEQHLIRCGSVDGRSSDITEYSEETNDKSVSIATFATENPDVALANNGFEVSSTTSETIEMDENSVESEYEVDSLASEMITTKGDCRWGTRANGFGDRLRRRREKRSRIMAKMSDLGSSLRELEQQMIIYEEWNTV